MSAAENPNPLTVGLSEPVLPQPCTLVIFGGAGDLSGRKLLPAIYNLGYDNLLPADFRLIGFGRREISDDAFRTMARDAVKTCLSSSTITCL